MFDTWWPGHKKPTPITSLHWAQVAMLQELNDAEVLTMAAIVQEAKFLDEAPGAVDHISTVVAHVSVNKLIMVNDGEWKQIYMWVDG